MGIEKLTGGKLMDVTIWHNPRCSKSRQTLELLRSRGVEPRVIEYLKTPPTTGEIRRVLDLMGVSPHALVRSGETVYRDEGLSKTTSDDTLVEAMFHNPILIERPVVIADDTAVLGRPPEKVLSII
jgi:arsenate reductase (glutaredoxin)